MKKLLVQIVSNLFPDIITSFVYKKFTYPQVHKSRQNELNTLEKADKDKYRFKTFDIQLYTWKGGNKKILLIHGWEGQAGNFSDLVEELLAHGYTIYSFDFPSHGFSSKGKTNLFDFTDLIVFLIKKHQIKMLVSHSFGSLATTYALFKNKELQIDKYVLLTTPDKFTQQIDYVSDIYGINKHVKSRVIDKFEKETDICIETLDVSQLVKSINVKKSLLIHDKYDKIIPVSRSKNVHKNWEKSDFKEVVGTGHFRILRTKEVINEIIKFLQEKKASS